MEPPDLDAVRRVLARFVSDEPQRSAAASMAPDEVAAYGAGHIHDTFLARRSGERFIVQRFNEHVFKDIDAVMSNIARVTDHAREHLLQSGVPDVARRVLRLRRVQGAAYLRADDGAAYRVFDYVPDSLALRTIAEPRVAFEAGRAFGAFVESLRDLPAPPLVETIPGFHDTAARLVAWREACQRDPLGRAPALASESALIEQHAELALACTRMAQHAGLPLRVTHNDAKLDNVLFDVTTQAALCVVDLDTVMPGYLAYDFGDLVRTTACTGSEDSRDLTNHGLRLDHFEALADGYLQQVSAFIEPVERESLAEGPLWILLELALRFLTDHVLGDRYFKVARPNQNLDRARVQLHLLSELSRQHDALKRVCARI